MTTDNPIEAVRARLDGGRKWCHDGNTTGPGGRACVGQTALTTAGQDALVAIDEVVSAQFPDRLTVWPQSALGRIIDFNDHPDATWADVDLVLDKAARRWDEQVRP